MREYPRKRLFGFSEIWRDNGTGTKDLYLFGLRVWRSNFFHSTGWSV